MAASKMSIRTLFDDYRQWVVKHPDLLSQIESVGRITSYLIAGRVNKSPAFSEFLYSATNIIVLINDQILRSAESNNPANGNVFEKSRVLITTLEYLQVFLEIAAYRIGGIQGKWITIFIIQMIKFLWRIYALIKDRAGLTVTRPLPPLNRKQFKIEMLQQERNLALNGLSRRNPVTTAYTLKSGRVIRKVEGAPQLHRRTWLPPAIAEETIQQLGTKTILKGNPLLGEVIYTAKPLCHLLALNRFGMKSWVPWLLALTMDVSSLKLLEQGKYNREEMKEIHRRQMTLLMYLLRSPFYDRYSRRILSFFLLKFSRIPLVGVLPKHLNMYLPYWQNLYSYTWD